MKKSRAEWEAEVERQALSGLSQAAYAKREGLSLSTFQYWRQKLKREESGRGGENAFVEVPMLMNKGGRSEIELELPHGIVLRVKGE